MTKIPNIIPITDLRQDATTILKWVTSSKEPLVITQRGRATAVLLNLEAYERSQQERELLRLLALGEREIAKGEGHSLESVLREADALLREGES